VKIDEFRALLDRVAKLHHDNGATGKAKALEDFSAVFESAKNTMTVQALVKKLKQRGRVGQSR
jgi:hypothetical protein